MGARRARSEVKNGSENHPAKRAGLAGTEEYNLRKVQAMRVWKYPRFDGIDILSPEHIATFESQVQRGAEGECWAWTGTAFPSGYGRMYLDGGVWLYAHRISFEIYNRPINFGEVVCHECDNPNCVNPAHLRADSQRANIREAITKKRAPQLTSEGHLHVGGRSFPREIRGGVEVTVCHSRRHVITPETLHIGPNGARRCRACWKETSRACHERAQLRLKKGAA